MVKIKKKELLSMITVRQAADAYIADARSNWSAGYASWLGRLSYFCDYVERVEGKISVSALTVEHGKGYKLDLQSRTEKYSNHPFHKTRSVPLSPEYIHGCLRAVRSFSTWLFDNDYIATNVMRDLKLPKLPKTQPVPLTDEELEQIMDAIMKTLERERNYAILLVFLDSGLRLSELRNLRISKIDWNLGVMWVMGKGSKEREVPFGSLAKRALLSYLETARPEPVTEEDADYVFLTADGYQITETALEKMIERIRNVTKISRLHPHLLRHSFAVRFLTAGADALSLQKILGHESLSTTRRYVNMTSDQLKEKHRKFSPADNLPALQRRRGRPKGSTKRSTK